MAGKSVEIRAELEPLGKWRDFWKLRDELRVQGMTAKDAAAESYRQVKESMGETPAVSNGPTGGEGGGVAAAGIPARSENAQAPPVGPPVLPAPAAAVPAPAVRRVLRREDQLIPKERVKEVFGNRKKPTKEQEDIWVEDSIDVAVELEDAPSISAWSRLMRVRLSSDLMRDFYRGRMALRQEKASKERFKDDGRESVELIERCQNAIYPSGAEGDVGESEVPEGGSGDGGAVEGVG